ncbi:AraC family transcriptional regulator [Streptomyces sp. ME02-8801-2C]|uniref:helix-turn-helix domain-containing protein n=1 Tax=Streptomyces sp. ME02-8801-2C TaxID=3028680 RepID=UPI0029AD1551|nr:AraC family transcriptional regulator [Streptomyces sp. ME02-8801-2C]MDX3452954.1 AraC family transcriptional regulator [Streptomyces sp. ME02-8801-2C]
MSSLIVPPALARWVAGIDVATATGSAAVDVPDHATTLILRTDKRELIVMGPRTRAAYHVATPGNSCVRVRMVPGRARALLGRSLNGLADGALPLHELPGLDIDQLAADPVTALEKALADRPEPSDRLEEAARLLVGATVTATAARLYISERRLHTLFTDATGLSPKHFARINRVRTVLAADANRWADIASAAGYYDQSHMTAEFRHFMGVPPAAFTAGRRPAATLCTA